MPRSWASSTPRPATPAAPPRFPPLAGPPRRAPLPGGRPCSTPLSMPLLRKPGAFPPTQWTSSYTRPARCQHRQMSCSLGPSAARARARPACNTARRPPCSAALIFCPRHCERGRHFLFLQPKPPHTAYQAHTPLIDGQHRHANPSFRACIDTALAPTAHLWTASVVNRIHIPLPALGPPCPGAPTPATWSQCAQKACQPPATLAKPSQRSCRSTGELPRPVSPLLKELFNRRNMCRNSDELTPTTGCGHS